MELYYIIHAFLLCSALFECSNNLRTKKFIMIFWCIFFTFFGGLRWEIGNDWDQYYAHFLNSEWSNIFSYRRNGLGYLEPGFVFINVLLKTLFHEFYIYNLIITGFLFFTYYKFCNHFSPKRPLLMFVCLSFWGLSYFIVRAGLSRCFIMWAFIYAHDRNLKKYLLFILLACLIHLQCLIILPMYWLSKIKLNFLWASLIYFVMVIVSSLVNQYIVMFSLLFGGDLGNKLYFYTQNQTDNYSDEPISFSTLAINYFFMCNFYYVKKKYANQDYFNLLICSFLIYISCFILFRGSMSDLTRLSSIYQPAVLILFVSTLNYYLKTNNNLIRFATIVFFIAYGLKNLLAVGSGYYFKLVNVPYTNIFDKNIF